MQLVDYMEFVDSFKKSAQIESRLILGNLELCSQPIVSIVIPTFRRPEFLEFALDSALNQTDAGCSYEVIVVDNDPTSQEISETEKLISRYQNPNLLYYRNDENLGIAGNWNRCALLARGEWVSFLHDDDILLPDYLCKVRKLLGKGDNIAGIMVLSYLLYDGNSLQDAIAGRTASMLSRMYDKLSRNKLMRLRQTDSHLKLSNIYGAPTCGSIFRKDLMVKSGGFNDNFHPSFDWFFLYRYCKKFRLYRSMERLGYYRFFANVSLMDKTKAAFIRDRISFAKYAAGHSGLGSMMRRLFSNEQNNAILNEEYSDFAGKEAEGFFASSDIKVRYFRKPLYRAVTQGYWHLKTIFSLIFG